MPEYVQKPVVRLRERRHELPAAFRIRVKGVLGGLHHEYSLESEAGSNFYGAQRGVWFIALEEEAGRDGFRIGKTLGCRDTDHNHVVKEHGDRLRLSVVHELGHLVMHRVLSGKSQKESNITDFHYGTQPP